MPNGHWRCIGNEGEHLPGYQCHGHPGRRTPMTIPVINSDRIVPGRGAVDPDGGVPTLRSIQLSANPNQQNGSSKANGQNKTGDSKQFPVMTLAIIGLIIYLIFK